MGLELSAAEDALIKHVASGTVMDLAPHEVDEDINDAVMHSWGEDHNLRAIVLRDILRGLRLQGREPDPRGIRIRGARIIGCLDLLNLTTPIPLALLSCQISEGVEGEGCTIPSLILEQCSIGSIAEDADRGCVRLSGAHVRGNLSMTGSILFNEEGPALSADSVTIDGGAFLDKGFTASGHGTNGTVRLLGARVSGLLAMRGAVLINNAGPALRADRLFVETNVFFDQGFTATGHGRDGAVRLLDAQISGPLDMSGATLVNNAGPALSADRLTVRSSVSLDKGFRASGHGDEGAVRLLSAHIEGQLGMRGATLVNDAGPALSADRVTIGGNAFFDKGFSAAGHGTSGTVRLSGARIDGPLEMGGALLINKAGPALRAESLTTQDGVFLDQGFTAVGHGVDGAVRLPGAHIGGLLGMRRAALTNKTGPALSADRIIVDSNAFLDNGFTAEGHGPDGAVRLLGAHIGGLLAMRGAALTNDDGPALSADHLTVHSHALLDNGFTAAGHGAKGALRLPGARIGGRLAVSLALSPDVKTKTAWMIDGLVFEGYPSVGFTEWLNFLRSGTTAYSPQPYQQLASAARAAGHDNEARQALIAQRRDQLKRGNLNWGTKAWARFTGVTLGFGYQPWRALIFVAATLAVSFVNSFFLYPQGFSHVGKSEQCTAVEKSQLAIDVVIPFVRTSIGTLCHTTTTQSGQLAAAINIGLTLVGWAFTALFAAGFTRAIRQP